MGLNVCLINPPIREWTRPNVPPLGLLLLSSVLRQAGHTVTIYDINGHRFSRDQVDTWSASARYDLYGVTGMITQWNYIRWLTETIKRHQPKSVIVAGGPVVSNCPDLFAQRMTAVDALVVGEGERAVLDVCRDVERRKLQVNCEATVSTQPVDAKTRTGLVLQKVETNKPVYQADNIEDLDEIPFPDYENLDTTSVYLGNPVGAMNVRKWIDGNPTPGQDIRNLCLLSTRSCVFRCRFCQPRYLGEKPRIRSSKNIADEIERLVLDHGVKYVHFCDELTFFSKKMAAAFSDELIRRGLHHHITWGVPARIDVLDRSSMERMREAGCILLGLGVESLSETVLKAMDKFGTLAGGVEKVVENIRIAREIIPVVGTAFIVGYPGETRETIQETIINMQKIGSDFRPTDATYATPYPGTYLWDYAVKQGHIKDPIPYIERINENARKMIINFTEIPFDELRVWKRRLECATFDEAPPPRPDGSVDEFLGIEYSYPH